MPRSRFLSGAVMAAATSLLASACTTGPAGAPSSGGDRSGGTVKIGVTSDVTSFDPAKGAGATDYVITSLLYQPLIGQDDGGTFVPGLAETWTSTPTKTSLTLKKGLTCSDGSALPEAIPGDLGRRPAHLRRRERRREDHDHRRRLDRHRHHHHRCPVG
jgi:peptide/nickel transport system substrate-binding protein